MIEKIHYLAAPLILVFSTLSFHPFILIGDFKCRLGVKMFVTFGQCVAASRNYPDYSIFVHGKCCTYGCLRYFAIQLLYPSCCWSDDALEIVGFLSWCAFLRCRTVVMTLSYSEQGGGIHTRHLGSGAGVRRVSVLSWRWTVDVRLQSTPSPGAPASRLGLGRLRWQHRLRVSVRHRLRGRTREGEEPPASFQRSGSHAHEPA